jgi:hypothetical protein
MKNKISNINTNSKLTLEKRNKYILYIDSYIDSISTTNKNHIMNILVNNLPDEVIIEKGIGTQINYDYIHNELIVYIYNYISSITDKKIIS